MRFIYSLLLFLLALSRARNLKDIAASKQKCVNNAVLNVEVAQESMYYNDSDVATASVDMTMPALPSAIQTTRSNEERSIIADTLNDLSVCMDELSCNKDAEEAMHWKLYSAAGKDHGLLNGMFGLYAVAKYYERTHEAKSHGALILYGRPEPWKANIEKYGRTKPSRDPRKSRTGKKKDDYRPPDTVRELVTDVEKGKAKSGKTTSKKQVATTAAKQVAAKEKLSSDKKTPSENALITNDVVEKLNMLLAFWPSFKWGWNSCWLDVSLQLLFVALRLGESDFRDACKDSVTGNNTPAFYQLVQLFNLWLSAQNEPNDESISELTDQRDIFRSYLQDNNLGQVDEYGCSDAWGWLYAIVAKESTDQQYLANSYFERLQVQFNICQGCELTGGRHMRLRRQPQSQKFHDMSYFEYESCFGRAELWFKRYTQDYSTDPSMISQMCWRNSENMTRCSNLCNESYNVSLTLPVILILNTPDEDELIDAENVTRRTTPWIFPKEIRPLGSHQGSSDMTYDIVGRVFHSKEKNHFITRYQTAEGIFHYDSLLKGFAEPLVVDDEVKLLSGSNIQNPPGGYKTSSVLYRLRGGVSAQMKFFKQQANILQTRHNLQASIFKHLKAAPTYSYNEQDLVQMSAEDRVWLRDPQSSKTVEYITRKKDGDDNHAAHPAIEEKEDNPSGDDNHGEQPTKDDKGDNGSNDSVSFTNKTSIDKVKKTVSIQIPESSVSGTEYEPSRSSMDCNSVIFEPPKPHANVKGKNTFTFKCRCGKHDPQSNDEESELIHCNRCKNAMHVACQRHGRASDLARNAKFTCDLCLYPKAALPFTPFQVPSPRINRAFAQRPVQKRLLSGKGALCRLGQFRYPVRLIKKENDKWKVKFWRECHFLPNFTPESLLMWVSENDLIDELWGNVKERRGIQLGKWTHAHEVLTEEDTMVEFQKIPITDETTRILSPHVQVLGELLDLDPLDRTASGYENIPALRFVRDLEKQRKGRKSHMRIIPPGTVPYAGDLTPVERGEIAHWFYINVPRASITPTQDWFGKVPLAHAFTIYIANTRKPEIDENEVNNTIENAWKYQESKVWVKGESADVDRDCLALLEKRMFERTLRAGRAGNHVWGLDAGPAQDRWDPYSGLPDSWCDSDYEGLDTDIEIGENYVDDEVVNNVPQQYKPPPKPRPLKPLKKGWVWT